MEKEQLFNQAYERYYSVIFKMVWNNTRNYELTLDFCQQTALICWLHMEQLEHWQEPERKGWIIRVTGNLMKDYWKKASTRREILLATELEEAENGTNIGRRNEEYMGFHQWENREMVIELMRQIRSKNESWYRLLMLLYLEEYSPEEAAVLLGISIDSLRARLYRARSYIRTAYPKGNEYRPG